MYEMKKKWYEEGSVRGRQRGKGNEKRYKKFRKKWK